MNDSSKLGPEEDDAAQALTGDLEAMATEVERQKDLYLRLAADFDNFRKRAAQEADRRAASQKEGFIRELLPVMDNLERALAAKSSASPKQLRQGVEMTLQQLQQLLRRHGIEAEDSLGQPFDPHRHEAIRTGHNATQPDHNVIEVCQRGYRRGNEVLRPAKVVVNDLSQPGPAGNKTHAG
jgi:molecular chaperone GrpE